MTTEIKSYEVRFYGGSKGHLKSRAQITLYGEGDERAGFIRFQDEVEDDVQRGELITMHLPTALLPTVLDVLREEETVTLHFTAGKGFLSTGAAEVGDDDDEDDEESPSAKTAPGQDNRLSNLSSRLRSK